MQVKDADVKVGDLKFMLSDLQLLIGGPSPRAYTTGGQIVIGSILGLGTVKTKVGKKAVTIDLNQASRILVRPLVPPVPVKGLEALVQVKQGSKVLATVHKRAELAGAPTPRLLAVRIGDAIVIFPAQTHPPTIDVPRSPATPPQVF